MFKWTKSGTIRTVTTCKIKYLPMEAISTLGKSIKSAGEVAPGSTSSCARQLGTYDFHPERKDRG